MNDPYVAMVPGVLMALAIMTSVELGQAVDIAEDMPGTFIGDILSIGLPGWFSILASFTGLVLASVTNAETETYLGLLIMAAFWAFFSGAVIAVTEREASRREAVGWTASFAAASLVAAFCFGMLL